MSKILFSLALIYIASSLIFFTMQLSKISEMVTTSLISIERIEKGENVNSILKSLDLVSKEIPHVLKEIKEVRKLTPSILKQVDNTTKTIPSILQEMKHTRESIPPILREVQKTRETIPSILAESKELRETIPVELNKVEKITQNVKNISDKAASGAVSGTVKGILTLPINLIKSATTTVTD